MSATEHAATDSTDAATDIVGPGIRRWRRALIIVGVLVLAWGAYIMLDTVRITRIPGVALWIGAAIVLHDAILAPVVFFAGVLLRRAGARTTGTVVIVVQGAIVVGSIVSLIVVPIIVAENFAPDNPSSLPLDYALNLGVFWLVLIVLTTGLTAWLYVRSRRANERPPLSQS